jgi:hypothetical protein
MKTERLAASCEHNAVTFLYRLQTKHLKHLPKTNTNKGKQRPSYQASKDFDNLEPDIRNANSLYTGKINFLPYYVNSMQLVCK